MAGAEEPKRPPNMYCLWLSECGDEFKEEAGPGKGAVARLAGEKWKAMSDADKKPYEERAAGLKAEYVKSMAEFRTAGGLVGKRRLEKAGVKIARQNKKVCKNAGLVTGMLEGLPPAYSIWFGANRENLTKGAVSAKGSDVAKFAGEKWKELADSIRAPFECWAAELKAEHQREMEQWRKESNQSSSDGDNDDDVDEGVIEV